MTHEQKPERVEFRTLLTITMTPTEYDQLVKTAEARGAAEQHRKDAEGACELDPAIIAAAMGITDAQKTLPEWVHLNPETGARSLGRWAKGIVGEHAPYVRADLALGPPNVTALEDRVKELEDVVRGYLEASDLFDACTMICPPRALFEAKDMAMHHLRAAVIREGGEHG